jgi:hypothetical protein
MLLGLGCSSENEPNVSDNGKEQPVNLKEEEQDVPEEEEPNVPEIVPVTEYRIECLSSTGTTLHGNLLIINSKEDFEKYFYFSEISDCPEIDFSKHTLLLAYGTSTYGVHKIHSELLFTGDEYVLKIEIIQNDATVAEHWRIALVTDKIAEVANVELDVTITRN